ncbi:WD repeat domain phosphoinositide-interacting protein 2-like [Sycon ciliatum]|uniref:WD repeat domain phosphoinositide-interacting protein 2-like n=1 Tax=Sycon ciliatum TaxID=27933 RepID=UPI0020A9E2A0
MNLSNDSNGPPFFVNFNQDTTSFAVGTGEGYKLYSLQNIDSLDQVYVYDGDEIGIVERLFSSSLVVLVSQAENFRLTICHFRKGTEICNYKYPSQIRSVRLNRERLAVLTDDCIFLHDILNMKMVHTIRDAPYNAMGVCALSTSKEANYLAYPGKDSSGQVMLFDTVHLKHALTINAHASPVVALAFSMDGKMIATASEKGTVIRVFSTKTAAKMFEFRRGLKRCVTIYTLAFSTDNAFLCASSNTETVHVFKLDATSSGPAASSSAAAAAASPETEKAEASQDQSWMSYFGSVAQAPARYLPSQLTSMTDGLAQPRAFAFAKLPETGHRTTCAFLCASQDNPIPRVLVACGDGHLYVYNVKPEGGQCDLATSHLIRPSLVAEPEPTPDAATSGIVGGLANLSVHGSPSSHSVSESSAAAEALPATDPAAEAAAASAPEQCMDYEI